MILVDTSIWVDHLRVGDRTLVHLLSRAQVLAHPWVTGEIALGRLTDRDKSSGCWATSRRRRWPPTAN